MPGDARSGEPLLPPSVARRPPRVAAEGDAGSGSGGQRFFFWEGGPGTGSAVGGDGKCQKEEMRVRRGVVLVKRGLKEGEKLEVKYSET